MAKKRKNWIRELPKLAQELLAAGYLRSSEPKGLTGLEGFLEFDPGRISDGLRRSDPRCDLAAAAYALLPWVSPDSNDLVASTILSFDRLGITARKAQSLSSWLVRMWNPNRLRAGACWPEYEVREHTVDLDVVLGHRKSGTSPFIAHGFLLHFKSPPDLVARIEELAGAVFQWKVNGGWRYSGPMLWAEVEPSESYQSSLSLYVTPYDLMNEGYADTFFIQLQKVPGIVIEKSGQKVEMPEHAVPLFGVDEDREWNKQLLRFLSPVWWGEEVFGAVLAPWFGEAMFPWRIPFSDRRSVISAGQFGNITANNALFWLASPDEIPSDDL